MGGRQQQQVSFALVLAFCFLAVDPVLSTNAVSIDTSQGDRLILSTNQDYSVTICQGEYGRLSCPGETYLHVVSAIATSVPDSPVCGTKNVPVTTRSCDVSVMSKVKSLCQKRSECVVDSKDPSLEMNSCQGHPLHINLNVACVWKTFSGEEAYPRTLDALTSIGDIYPYTNQCAVLLLPTYILSWIMFGGFFYHWIFFESHIRNTNPALMLPTWLKNVAGAMLITDILYSLSLSYCTLTVLPYVNLDHSAATHIYRRRLTFRWAMTAFAVWTFGLATRSPDFGGKEVVGAMIRGQQLSIAQSVELARSVDEKEYTASGSITSNAIINKNNTNPLLTRDIISDLYVQFAPRFVPRDTDPRALTHQAVMKKFPTPQKGNKPGQFATEDSFQNAMVAIRWARTQAREMSFAGKISEFPPVPMDANNELGIETQSQLREAQRAILLSYLLGTKRLSFQKIAQNKHQSKQEDKTAETTATDAQDSSGASTMTTDTQATDDQQQMQSLLEFNSELAMNVLLQLQETDKTTDDNSKNKEKLDAATKTTESEATTTSTTETEASSAATTSTKHKKTLGPQTNVEKFVQEASKFFSSIQQKIANTKIGKQFLFMVHLYLDTNLGEFYRASKLICLFMCIGVVLSVVIIADASK
eukprot:c2938_g1_i1.p1 GENE.c2938_g1_i1~~c2938_g1_i1.p1  ORF type:complete len:658 (-),score=154.34 c2938_g1_i1:43-1977(-)